MQRNDMKKLKNGFGKDFASSAFKTIDDEAKIVGKFYEETLMADGTYDVWIVRPDREPIGTRKLNNLESSLSSIITNNEAVYSRLDGEAYLHTSDKSYDREVALLLGIKRRKQYSEAERQRKRERLAAVRAHAA